jgi:hypothetical protein
MQKPKNLKGKIYTAFPEGHYQRKIEFDINQKEPGGAFIGIKLDFHPKIQILPTCFSFTAAFEVTSDMFDIHLFLYQRVDFPEPLNLKKYLEENSDIIKEVILNASPHAAKIIWQLVLNMGFRAEEDVIREQVRDTILKLEKKQFINFDYMV